ncbi:tyrosine-type recombinase/integrase [Rhodococcus jostii]|uniref:tyrosine-type recombinase/integrase n=1 Tax=Rhodococcus jostii TaxID=132919 RepID=UPI003642CA65
MVPVRRARKAGAYELTPHDLRHTAASLAVSAGANVKAVQRMLGHESAALTLDVYADLFDDDLDSVADALDAARRRIIIV